MCTTTVLLLQVQHQLKGMHALLSATALTAQQYRQAVACTGVRVLHTPTDDCITH
jgi:hypothetical protein